MARIERESYIDSTLVDKEFLVSLFKIIDDLNPKNIGVKTEITVSSEEEKSIYENLEDFIDSRIVPREIIRLSIKKTPHNKRDREKAIQFFLNLDQNPEKSYYRLIGYDDGKLSSAQKQLETLFDIYRNWYNFIFYPSIFEYVIRLGMGFSLGVFVYNILNLIPISSGISTLGGIGGFFLWLGCIDKFSDRLFPFIDFQIRTTKRSQFWRYVFGTLVLGLIVNLIWYLVLWIISLT